MRSYETARNLFSFLSFCAWAVIVLGVIFAFVAGGAVSAGGFGGPPSGLQIFLAALPGGIVALAGVFGLAMVQIGRTSVDSAEYAQQSLDVSRQHLEIAKQTLAQGKIAAASYAGISPPASQPTPNGTEVAAAEVGASYASQPATSATATPREVAALSEPSGTNVQTPAIEHKAQMPMAALPTEIVYNDGKYLVGEKQFFSRVDAQRYQQDLAPSST